jgi:hypothetical protein
MEVSGNQMSEQPQSDGILALPALYLALDGADPARREQIVQEMWRISLHLFTSGSHDFWWLTTLGLYILHDLMKDWKGATTVDRVFRAVEQLCITLARNEPTESLKDTDAPVRALAVWTMGHIRNDQAVCALCIAIIDAKPVVRQLAAEALGNIGSEQAVHPLCQALNDPDKDVRRHAAVALGKIGDPAALPVLRAKICWWNSFSGFEERAVQHACREAIEMIEKAAGGTLPRPASASEPDAGTLPRPAGVPEPDIETLPRATDDQRNAS